MFKVLTMVLVLIIIFNGTLISTYENLVEIHHKNIVVMLKMDSQDCKPIINIKNRII